ncbi:MAG: hypothetical protein ABW187_10915 [Dokdonella sp.]
MLSASSGIVVLSPVENAANSLYQIAYVATMGLAFFSPPVAAKFARDARAFAAGDDLR